ncbi:hypothetical protein [Kiloniella sp. EL199]|uniref:hypothetical protein n=1 Tax=Kiloniella sp. EL199 TaxID=2107581 RepID=UPI000EA034D3|nr:hypothetical protein [Kiloniella sp. EL199]
MYIHHPKKEDQKNGFVDFSDLFDDIVPFYEINKNKQPYIENRHHLLDGKTQQYLSNSIIDIHESPIKL